MATLNTVLKDIQTLSASDRKKVLVALKALTKDADDKDSTESTHYSFFYSLMGKLLTNHSRTRLAPFKVFKAKDPKYSDLVQCVDSIDDFLKNISGCDDIRREVYLKMYTFFLELVSDDILKRDSNLNINTILYAHNYFTDLIDRQFPFYIKNKVLYQLVINSNKKIGNI